MDGTGGDGTRRGVLAGVGAFERGGGVLAACDAVVCGEGGTQLRQDLPSEQKTKDPGGKSADGSRFPFVLALALVLASWDVPAPVPEKLVAVFEVSASASVADSAVLPVLALNDVCNSSTHTNRISLLYLPVA